MRAIWNRASAGEAREWVKDVAGLVSIAAFLWATTAWLHIAEVMVG
jgi:hypothetical protein